MRISNFQLRPALRIFLIFSLPLIMVVCGGSSSSTSSSSTKSTDITITAVSGTLTDGGTITITGSNLGTKTTAAPLIWDNFEWGNPNDNISNNGWINQSASFPPQLTSTLKYSGNNSAFNSLSQGTVQFGSAYKKVTASLEFYTSYMLYWDYTNGTDGIFKLSRFNAVQVYSGYPQLKIQFQPNGNDPETGWIYATHQNGTDTFQTSLNGAIMSSGKWLRVEMYLKLSDPPGSTNGKIEISFNNINQNSVWYTTPTFTDITRATGINDELEYFLLPLMWASNLVAGASTNVYVDDVYLDNTLARVEICDSKDINSVSNCELQIPSNWSSTEVTFTVNQGAFSSFNNLYLYVYDKDGNVNSTGYSIVP